jgi:hypothetical protein
VWTTAECAGYKRCVLWVFLLEALDALVWGLRRVSLHPRLGLCLLVWCAGLILWARLLVALDGFVVALAG